MNNKASNAVLALSRAFYGKRLTAAEYADLLACKSIDEVASYLRTRTAYADAFRNAGGATFTAYGLENVISGFILDRFNSIARYEKAIGDRFYRYFIIRAEVDEILRCTLLMLGGNTEGYLMQFGDFLDRNVTIDLYALGRANSVEEIAATLERSMYGKVYRSCMSSSGSTYLTFENAFEDLLRRQEVELLKKSYSGREREEMKNVISRRFDIDLITKLYRIASYYKGIVPNEEVLANAYAGLTMLSDKQLRALKDAQSEEDITAVLSSGTYKDVLAGGDTGLLRGRLNRAYYEYCKKQIRFSSYPAVVMFAYTALAENEKQNLIRIIEGIKYKISPETIMQSLVGVGD